MTAGTHDVRRVRAGEDVPRGGGGRRHAAHLSGNNSGSRGGGVRKGRGRRQWLHPRRQTYSTGKVFPPSTSSDVVRDAVTSARSIQKLVWPPFSAPFSALAPPGRPAPWPARLAQDVVQLLCERARPGTTCSRRNLAARTMKEEKVRCSLGISSHCSPLEEGARLAGQNLSCLN